MTVQCLAGLGGQWSFLGGWLNKVKPMPILAQVNIDPKQQHCFPWTGGSWSKWWCPLNGQRNPWGTCCYAHAAAWMDFSNYVRSLLHAGRAAEARTLWESVVEVIHNGTNPNEA